MREAARIALTIFALGAILMPLSEAWFYDLAPDVDAVMLALCYGLMGYLAFASAVRGSGAWALILGGALMGFVAEGLVVSELYLSLPFSIAWTPLAWHLLVSVVMGLWLWRLVMARAGIVLAASYAVALGLFLGAWSAFMWMTDEAGEAIAEPDVTAYALQSGLAALAFGAGHWTLSWIGERLPGLPRSWELLVLAGAATALWALAWAVPLFPLSLILPALCVLTALALWRGRGDPTWWARALTLPIRPVRHLLAALVPAASIPVFWLHVEFGWRYEINAWVALVTIPVSVGLWVWALWRGISRGAPPEPASGYHPGS